MQKYLEDYYSSFDEDSRLDSRLGQVEFLTSMRYIEKYLTAGARVLDIGAGTGKYSLALESKTCIVDAVEPVLHNINIFKSKIGGKSITIRQGDARDLSAFKDNAYDIVLIFGPLYHLFTKEDKQKVISEAFRVAKTGGVIFAAYCMTDATLFDQGFKRKRFNIMEYIKQGLLDPVTFRATSKPELLFEVVRREDIDEIMHPFNFARLHYVATDLYSRHMQGELEEMDENLYKLYLDYHFSICERSDLVGITHHSLDIFKKLSSV